MLSKKSFGIAGAAMLGTVALLGTNAANAAMNLDDADEATVTYAQETVTGMVGDEGMYYEVMGAADNGALAITHSMGVGGTQDHTFRITYTLEGMVFGVDVTDASIAMAETVGGDTINLTEAERVKEMGGAEGDDSVQYLIKRQTEGVSVDNALTLNVESFGVTSSGGTIKVTVENIESGGMAMPDNMGMVMFDTGVKITDVRDLEGPAAADAIAKTYVARNYSDFGLEETNGVPNDPEDPILMDHVGGFTVGTQHLAADDGLLADFSDVFGSDLANDMITFDDDWFEFLASAWLDDSASCEDQAGGQTVWGSETEGDDSEIMSVTLDVLGAQATGMVTTMHYLCLMAGVKAIQATMYYTADTMFVGVEGAKMPLMNMDNAVQLGRIERDGITIRLPYLTTYEGYNQRLVVVNRNNNRVAYSLDYAPEDGAMATDRMDADDMMVDGTCVGQYGDDCTNPLHGVTTVIKVTELVTIDGATRTAATLMLESVPGMVDVATTQVNRENGGTDTIVYESEAPM